jgi:uncharacterized membrane protein HdeD (DUF308 family)
MPLADDEGQLLVRSPFWLAPELLEVNQSDLIQEVHMATELVRPRLITNWWALAIRGIAGILFGIAAFLVPGITLVALVYLFAAYAFVDGLFSIAAGIKRGRHGNRWLWMILQGFVGLAAGIVAASWPAVTALVLVYIIAGWAIASGVLEITAAIALRKKITREWLLVLAGIASIAFGVLMASAPAPGALVLVWWIGAYALVIGVLLLVLAFRVRSADSYILRHPESLAA